MNNANMMQKLTTIDVAIDAVLRNIPPDRDLDGGIIVQVRECLTEAQDACREILGEAARKQEQILATIAAMGKGKARATPPPVRRRRRKAPLKSLWPRPRTSSIRSISVSSSRKRTRRK